MVQEKYHTIRLAKPYLGDISKIESRLREVLDSGFLVQGKYVEEFENSVARYLGCKHAVAVSSATAALHLSLMVLHVGPGDEVIVPSFTFPATANVVELVGAKPVLVDVNIGSYNIDVESAEGAVSDKTKAIIPVHLFGTPADMKEIIEISKAHDMRIIEDSAGAFGSKYAGTMCGTMGDLGCISFHPRKILTTGEGGMILTDNGELAEQLRSLRNHGIRAGPEGPECWKAGLNYRMTEIQAVLGVTQMERIDGTIEERTKMFLRYKKALGDESSIHFQQGPKESETVPQALVVRLENKNNTELIKRMAAAGIETNIGTYAVHMLEYYRRKYGYNEEDFPSSSTLRSHSLALPFYNGLRAEQIELISSTLMEEMRR